MQRLVPYAQKAKKGVAASVLPLILLTPGSGGAMTASGADQLNRWIYHPIINVEHSLRKGIDLRSPADQVSEIRDVYGLNMSELANVLGVTRPTVYAWLSGQEPKPESLVHIKRLSSVTPQIKELNVPRRENLIRRPIFEGKSLLEKIKCNENILEALTTLRIIAQNEMASRFKQKGSGKSKRSIEETSADMTTPVYDRG